MINPPRNGCQGRPMVCPGQCNPLKAHHHHHHHHHRRHHRQKPDMTEIVTPEKEVLLPDEFSQLTLLRSSKRDASVTSMTSKDAISISTTSSSTKIAVIRIPKISQFKKADVPAIIQQILSPSRLERLEEPPKLTTEKKSELAPLRKIGSNRQSPIATITYPKETAARATLHQTPRNCLNKVICAIMLRLNRMTLKITSPLLLGLIILTIYVGIHILLAIIARTSAYQFFMSSQICGIFAFLMWRLTGTILI
ncbi:hypothetical protein ALC56_12018 [Trachymyrmex septentrionalis]|uniref:Uncharacterized protein n=1 Tax=Trachymyrmex septentrionalis TaxID=34720 RepID=A0A195EZN0_9HYME|nr:PREDICTED: protein FAM76B-like [Trachymyrmex septentrionalis]XP_018350428.1 PREDICTED: protein FAM76B-like [Trachymyrmex septentrionalis]XP_018350429.1 PREDICTED: protein FAM76B-like [Trachymyrmex septentrionalis]KYN33760.1 hypothetical protein ALC56_12018 [Trachymyrmex septentrionalis]